MIIITPKYNIYTYIGCTYAYHTQTNTNVYEKNVDERKKMPHICMCSYPK